MPIDKLYQSAEEALACLKNGDVVGISGFEGHGEPTTLLHGLNQLNLEHLTLVFDLPIMQYSLGENIISEMCKSGKVDTLITTNAPQNPQFENYGSLKKIVVEVLDRNLIAERLRVIGAGLGSVEFMRPTAYNKQHEGIRLDVALIKGLQTDHLGNTIYEGTKRNWSPVMAMAARITIAESDSYVEAGSIDPEGIITPGIYVNRVVCS